MRLIFIEIVSFKAKKALLTKHEADSPESAILFNHTLRIAKIRKPTLLCRSIFTKDYQ